MTFVGSALEQALVEGDVYWAYEAFYQFCPSQEPATVENTEKRNNLCSAQRAFSLLLGFLKKTQSLVLADTAHTKTKASPKPCYNFFEASENFFYTRMKVACLVLTLFGQRHHHTLERGETTSPLFGSSQTFDFLKSLLREYATDQWGNLEAVGLKESQKREEILRIVFSQKDVFSCDFSFEESLELLKRFSFERDNVYALMCDQGVFDLALVHDKEKTQDILLVSLTGKNQSGVSSACELFVSNLINRSFLLKRAVLLGVLGVKDCKRKHFGLLDITWDKACVTEELMKQGMKLPVLDKDIFRLSPIYMVEQLKTWAFYDSEGMAQRTQTGDGTQISLYFFMENLRKVRNIFFADKTSFSSWEEERDEIERTLFDVWQGVWAKHERHDLWRALTLLEEGGNSDTTEEETGTGGKGRKKM